MFGPHLPVMAKEIVENIGEINGGCFLDLTFGEGGHSEKLLSGGARSVVGLDRDREAILRYQEQGTCRSDARLTLIHSAFSKVSAVVPPQKFDGILIDLGVSTHQILHPERGFTFNGESFLDMRMDRSPDNLDASEAIRCASEAEVAHCLDLAGVRKAMKVARLLKEIARSRERLTPADLRGLGQARSSGRNPATQLFLGIRLLVNQEFLEISSGIPRLIDYLRPGGRLLILTFHSAEDRVVKRTLTFLSGGCVCEAPVCLCPKTRLVTALFKKPLQPQRSEIRINPRSRSAKLRGVVRMIEKAQQPN